MPNPFPFLLGQEIDSNFPKLSLSQIFQSPWASNAEDEEKFTKYVEEIVTLDLDENALGLITVVALTEPKGSYEDQKKVNSVHGSFVTLLKRHLNSKEKMAIFHKLAHILTLLKEMADIIVYKRILFSTNSFIEQPVGEENLTRLLSFMDF